MRTFKVDLHVHTLLSPCGSLDMNPREIIRQAKLRGIDILAITDHNSTLQVILVHKMGAEAGITIFFGVEINTSEEIHCLALFETNVLCKNFQKYLDEHLQSIKNKPEIMGDQVVVNHNDEIVFEEERLLIAALDVGISDVEKQVHALGGIFIPAHIDRPSNSLISQLGFLPDNLKLDGVEISSGTQVPQFVEKHAWIKDYPVVRGSDAHFPEDLGKGLTLCKMEEPTFSAFRRALESKDENRISVL